MEIPPDILEELKCNECEGYLSRSPVYLQHDGAAVCGVCFSPKSQATRNKQYEATAKLLLFPCKNRNLGCQEKVPFFNEAEMNRHEEVCKHRQYVCPVLGVVGSSPCDWEGSLKDILKHCEEQHADKVTDNPTTLTHDISKSSEETFLLRAFKLIFLLHVKICVTSGKIYHAIRYLGRSDEVKNFTFQLDIKRADEHISRKGRVAPQDCLSFQEDSSLAVNINSLLDMMGGFSGITFTVTLQRLASALEKCAKCKVLITSFIYREGNGWWCKQCTPAKVKCANCTYMDVSHKNEKHKYFCNQTSKCNMCSTTISIGSLHSHYMSTHNIGKYNSGSTWRARWTGSNTGSNGNFCLLSSASGVGLLKYWLDNSELSIYILIPVPSEQLCKFKCVVRVTQVATGQTYTYSPDTVYNNYYDWIVQIKKEKFTAWSHEFDVFVDTIQIEL